MRADEHFLDDHPDAPPLSRRVFGRYVSVQRIAYAYERHGCLDLLPTSRLSPKALVGFRCDGGKPRPCYVAFTRIASGTVCFVPLHPAVARELITPATLRELMAEARRWQKRMARPGPVAKEAS